MAEKSDLVELLGEQIGRALKDLREEVGTSARQLSNDSGVSQAMISRIESGQVSPSIATLAALSTALDIPLSGLFRETTTAPSDMTFVQGGAGLHSTRILGDHAHDYVSLAVHRRRDMQFDAQLITLSRGTASPPVYVGRGVIFIYALKGEALFRYGVKEIALRSGDSLSFDAEIDHGFQEVTTEQFVFLNVQGERR